jgi:hypothetical protein
MTTIASDAAISVVEKAIVAERAARPTYVLTLRATSGRDTVRDLRRLLKFALRACHLRALAVEEHSRSGRDRYADLKQTKRKSFDK